MSEQAATYPIKLKRRGCPYCAGEVWQLEYESDNGHGDTYTAFVGIAQTLDQAFDMAETYTKARPRNHQQWELTSRDALPDTGGTLMLAIADWRTTITAYRYTIGEVEDR